jgi:hypothetical protein
MGIERRLRALESDLGGSGLEKLRLEVHREALARLTDEELQRYHDALEAAEREGEWAEKGLPILQRVEDLMEKVANE